jgi:uncharacterized membrane protein
MVEEFFAKNTNDSRRQGIVQQYSVDYVFYGPAEQALGDYAPGESGFLSEVFSSPQVRVYAVPKTDDE